MIRAGDLVVSLRADLSRLTAGLKGGEIQVRSFAGRIVGASEGLKRFGVVATAIGAGMLAIMSKAIGTFAEFEQQIANTASVVGAVGEEMKKLETEARRVGVTTIFMAQEAANAMYYLASAGLETNEVIGALRGTLALAAATWYDLSDTTFIVVSALRQWRMEATEATRIANVMASAISSSQATMHKLGESLKYVGPLAASLGISFEQTVATLGVVYNAGIAASQAGTALRQSLIRLQQPTGQAYAAMERLGLALEDVSPQYNNLIDIVESLEEAIEEQGMTIREAGDEISRIFGIRAVTVFQVLLMAGSKALREMEERITDTNKAFSMMDIQIRTLKGSVKLLTSALQEIAIQIGQGLEPVLRPLINGLVVLTRQFAALPKWIKATIGFVLLVGGALLTLAGVISMLLGVMAPLILAGMAMGGVLTTTILPVIGVAVVALGGLVAVLYALSGKLDHVSTKIRAWEDDTEAFIDEQKEMNKVLERYNELMDVVSRGEETTVEQRNELRMIQSKLAALFPETIRGYNEEGKAVQFDTDAVKELVEAKGANLELTKTQLYLETHKDLQKLIRTRQRHVRAIEDEAEKAEDYRRQIEEAIQSNILYKQGMITLEQAQKSTQRFYGQLYTGLGKATGALERHNRALSGSEEELDTLLIEYAKVIDISSLTSAHMAAVFEDVSAEASAEYMQRMRDLVAKAEQAARESSENIGTIYEESLRNYEDWLKLEEEGLVASNKRKLEMFNEFMKPAMEQWKNAARMSESMDENALDHRERLLKLELAVVEDASKEKIDILRAEIGAMDEGLDKQIAERKLKYMEDYLAAEGSAELRAALLVQLEADITKLYKAEWDRRREIREEAQQDEMDAADALWQLRLDAMDEGINKELFIIQTQADKLMRIFGDTAEGRALIDDMTRKATIAAWQDEYDKVAQMRTESAEDAVALLELLLLNTELTAEQILAIEENLELAKRRMRGETASQADAARRKEAQEAMKMFRIMIDLSRDLGEVFSDIMTGGFKDFKDFLKKTLTMFLNFVETYYVAFVAYKTMEAYIKGSISKVAMLKVFAEIAKAQALISIAKGVIASFKEGGVIQGSQYGEIVRVGEGYTKEYIMPEADLNKVLQITAARGIAASEGMGINEKRLASMIGQAVGTNVERIMERRTSIDEGQGVGIEEEPIETVEARTWDSRQFVRKTIIPEIERFRLRKGR